MTYTTITTTTTIHLTSYTDVVKRADSGHGRFWSGKCLGAEKMSKQVHVLTCC